MVAPGIVAEDIQWTLIASGISALLDPVTRNLRVTVWPTSASALLKYAVTLGAAADESCDGLP